MQKLPQIGFNALPRQLQNDALIDVKVVLALTGYRSPTVIYNRMKAGTFPQSIKLSHKCTRWRCSEVRTWLAQQGQPIAEAA